MKKLTADIEASCKKGNRTELAAAFQKSQSMWISYRDAQISLETQLPPHSEKSPALTYYDMTSARLDYLQEFLSNINQADKRAVAHP